MLKRNGAVCKIKQWKNKIVEFIHKHEKIKKAIFSIKQCKKTFVEFIHKMKYEAVCKIVTW